MELVWRISSAPDTLNCGEIECSQRWQIRMVCICEKILLAQQQQASQQLMLNNIYSTFLLCHLCRMMALTIGKKYGQQPHTLDFLVGCLAWYSSRLVPFLAVAGQSFKLVDTRAEMGMEKGRISERWRKENHFVLVTFIA